MSIRKSSKEDGKARLTEENRRRAQNVFYKIESGIPFPDGDWEQQIGIAFENRIRKEPKNMDEDFEYLSRKQIKNLLMKSLEWVNDYFAGHNRPSRVTPLPPPEEYKDFLNSPLFSRKGLSREN